MQEKQVGLLILGLAAVLAVVGLLVWSGGLSWFGRLPGDIRIERESARVHIPITSMLLISLVLSALLYVIRRIF